MATRIASSNFLKLNNGIFGYTNPVIRQWSNKSFLCYTWNLFISTVTLPIDSNIPWLDEFGVIFSPSDQIIRKGKKEWTH